MLDWERILGQLAAVKDAPIPFVIALLVVAVFLWWAINWKYSSVVGHRDAEISRLKVERDEYKAKLSGAMLEPAKATIDKLPDAARGATAAERLIKDTYIDWAESGRVSFRGRFTRAGGPLSIYVTYGSANQSPAFPRTRTVVAGKLFIEPRIKVGAIAHFDNEETADITIGTVSRVEGNQEEIQWGELEQKNTKVGLSWSNYFCFLILAWENGREELYPFVFVSRSHSPHDANSTMPERSAILGPDVLSAYWGMQDSKK